jgi:hypothetical protein
MFIRKHPGTDSNSIALEMDMMKGTVLEILQRLHLLAIIDPQEPNPEVVDYSWSREIRPYSVAKYYPKA